MPKTVKKQQPAARPRSKPLTLTVKIHGDLAPMFKAGMNIMGVTDAQRFLEWLIVKGLTSEALMDRFDEHVNKLLKE